MAGPYSEIHSDSVAKAKGILDKEKCVRLSYRNGVSRTNEYGVTGIELRLIEGPVEWRDSDGAMIAGTYVKYDQMATFYIKDHFLVPRNRTGVAAPHSPCSE
jgi:hypothetical protein